MDMTSVYAPITKSYEQDDGSVIVEGIITDSNLDFDQQRCDPDWLKKAVPTWMAFGNLREQHDKHRAVGKAIEHRDLGEDGHFIRGRVVDTEAVKKVKAGIFNGFSIGVMDYRLSKSADTPNGVICGGRICEVSLVDYPCNENCRLTMVKSAKPGMTLKSGDFDSERMLVRVEELVEKPVERPEELRVTLADRLDPAQAALLESKVEPVVTSKGLQDGHKFSGDIEKHLDQLPGEDDRKAWLERYDTLYKQYSASPFDRDEAIALVKAAANPETATNVLAGITVPPTAPPPEIDDILRAKAAIAIIGQLIQGEAANLATRPYQDCDIELLMQAVHALRYFMCRERDEPGDGDGTTVELSVSDKSVDADLGMAKYTAAEKRKMLADGEAMKGPDGEPDYPIGDKDDLGKAIRAVGRGKGNHDAIRAFIKRRASALGAADMIPDTWSEKDATPDIVKGSDDQTADGDETPEGEAPSTETDKSVEAEAAPSDDTEAHGATAGELEKAAVADDGENLVKALSDALEKADSPLRKHFESIVEAATQSTAKSVTELAERLEKVEQMGVPGGPALRRTEVERTQARKGDLTSEVVRYKSLAANAEDHVLRKGYTQKAAQLEAEMKAL